MNATNHQCILHPPPPCNGPTTSSMPHAQGSTTIEYEQAIQDALAAVQNSQFTSIGHAATELNLPDSTLYARDKGVSSCSQAHAKQQNLTEAEENALVKWVTQLLHLVTLHVMQPYMRWLSKFVFNMSSQ